MTEQLWKLGARRLGTMIAQGEVSTLEVVNAHIDRIESVNPLLNAVVVKRYDQAREEAEELDQKRARGEPLGPLHGVPVTVKESLDFGGLPTTYGVTAHRHDFPGKDELHVGRLRDAGAVVLGKTNVAQLLMFLEADNPVYGRTQNPWALDRSPGGSSGGEGAIIAALGSPLGVGSDIGGSVRNPASSCGIVGFKPTAGRLPDAGRGSAPIGQLAIQSQVGFLARRVEDVTLALDVASGARNPAEGSRSLGEPSSVELSKLVVGFYTDDGFLPACGAAVRAVHEARDALSRRGATCIPFTPPELVHGLTLFHEILAGDGGHGMRRFLDGSPADFRIKQLVAIASASRPTLAAIGFVAKHTKRRKLATLLGAYGRRDVGSHWDAVASLEEYRAKMLAALDRGPAPIDVLLSPATALPAVRHGGTAELGVMGAYDAIYNVLGYPAGVVPFTRVFESEETSTPRTSDRMDQAALDTERGSSGLPIGVQVAARPFREHVALAVLGALEEDALARSDRPGPDSLPSLFR
ncbi:MAG TPA: amidase family protein [Polyangiaceae bacterium]|jgi:fatty acid amide hydrolase|nr:amidase family protein [Polyangiaceae bacterium]